MKTKEEIYCKNGGSYIRSAETEGHLKAMQEYADQQLEAYKAKLKDKLDTIRVADNGFLMKAINHAIDTTTP